MSLLTGLQGYWKCDESSGNLIDYSGNTNTLVNLNGATFASGKINNGIVLVRTSSQSFKITNANQTGLNFTSDFTFAFWINVVSQPGTNQAFHLIGKSDEAADERAYGLVYYDTSGVKSLELALHPTGGSGAWDNHTLNTTLPTGTLAHVVVKWNHTTHIATYIIDRNVVGTISGTLGISSIYDCVADFTIGSYNSSLHYADVIFDEIGVWSRELSYEEVLSLNNNGNGLTYPFTTTLNTRESITIDGDDILHTFTLGDSNVVIRYPLEEESPPINPNTLTDTRIVKRVISITSSPTPTINTDECDVIDITELATAITSMTTNLTGTPNNKDLLELEIKDNGTARSISWGSAFVAGGTPLPTTTVANKILAVLFQYSIANNLNKWRCVGVQQET
jgi:hypothetical protein